MARLIDNEAIEDHFPLEDYLPAAERMYRELGEGRAASTATETVLSRVPDPPSEATEPVFHGLRTSGGSIKDMGVSAIRLNSDLKHWPESGGTTVQERLPIVDGRYNGLVFLFSNETGELLLIFPDGILQTYHVAGGIAVGAKYLAREDATVLGMYGCGHQADAHLPALDRVCELETVKVYSPTPAHRRAFASRMDRTIAATVRAVDDPREVCRGADIVNCATNATEPVFDPSWVEPGTHVGTIRPAEMPTDLFGLGTVEKLVITKSAQRAVDITGDSVSGYRTSVDNAADPWRFYVMGADPLHPKLRSLPTEPQPIDDVRVTRLPDIVSGDADGRTSPDEITILRQVGHGIAFAAIGHVLYRIAEEHDLGAVVPSDKLTQAYVP